MAKKQKLQHYEVFIRTNGAEKCILSTFDTNAAGREYARQRSRDVFVRVRVDGHELRIYEADRMCSKFMSAIHRSVPLGRMATQR
ncbi:MAG: hypothetical protein EOM66_03830 [Clostridia bacterium]|nr:hypothetical protein [Clostridia bacterium]